MQAANSLLVKEVEKAEEKAEKATKKAKKRKEEITKCSNRIVELEKVLNGMRNMAIGMDKTASTVLGGSE